MAAGWPVPTTEEAGTEFDRAAGARRELGEPGAGCGGQRSGSGREGRARSVSPASEEGFPPTSATQNRALGCSFCSAFRGKLWEEMATRQGSCSEEAEGREAEE